MHKFGYLTPESPINLLRWNCIALVVTNSFTPNMEPRPSGRRQASPAPDLSWWRGRAPPGNAGWRRARVAAGEACRAACGRRRGSPAPELPRRRGRAPLGDAGRGRASGRGRGPLSSVRTAAGEPRARAPLAVRVSSARRRGQGPRASGRGRGLSSSVRRRRARLLRRGDASASAWR